MEGEPDPVTGMVIDLRELKEILNQEVVEPWTTASSTMKFRPLIASFPPPKISRIDIWKRLEPRLATGGSRLHTSAFMKRRICTWTILETPADSR